MSKYNAIDNIKLAFLGCGNITAKHAKLVSQIDPKAELSFASRTLIKSQEYQSKFKGHSAFGSYNDAIENEDINIIMINTPPNSHFELANKVLSAGKHCIVEKPPFLKSSDFDTLGKIAEEKGLQLIVAENYYYKPLRRKLKSILESAIIGKPLFVQINATKKQKSKNDWREDKSLTGYGALFEGGIHWINFINNLGFDINAADGFFPTDQELERSSQVVAKSTQGTVINLLYSWEVDTIAGGLRISKIYGTEGSITFESNGVFVFARGSKKKLAFPNLRNISGFKLMWQDFIQAIKSGNAPEMNWQMAKKDLEIIESIYETRSVAE